MKEQFLKELESIRSQQPTLESVKKLAEMISEFDELVNFGETELGFLSRLFQTELKCDVEKICDHLRKSSITSSKYERQLRTVELLFNELGGDKPEVLFGSCIDVNVYWEECNFTWIVKNTQLAYPAIKVIAVKCFEDKPPEVKYFRFVEQLLEYTKTVL